MRRNPSPGTSVGATAYAIPIALALPLCSGGIIFFLRRNFHRTCSLFVRVVACKNHLSVVFSVDHKFQLQFFVGHIDLIL